ncbi:MAG: hypothetical protein DSM106950_43285 [Stigonema ocellatum SAG 48.90 = DSM 106950]|nr:hypothetical protein [Stigonema ocellatum SAG 48.90 = DSM 106950]
MSIIDITALMTEYFSKRSDVILLDIEGTTTSVEYVFSVLFPFAKVHVDVFLQTHHQEQTVQTDLKSLRLEYEADRTQGISVPEWNENSTTGAVPYIHYLIEVDRKSTGLKSFNPVPTPGSKKDVSGVAQINPRIKSAISSATGSVNQRV